MLASLVLLQPRLAILENVCGLLKHLKSVMKLMRRMVGEQYHIVVAAWLNGQFKLIW